MIKINYDNFLIIHFILQILVSILITYEILRIKLKNNYTII